MSLLHDILAWTKTELKLWQRDAVRRLFQKPEGLSSKDYDELFELLKIENGFPNPNNLKPYPLDDTHLSKASPKGTKITLSAMHDLKNVNRIVPEQKLSFSPTGITVIYGDNGSGKSGYARVLKRTCRARDGEEKVLPDATDPKAQFLIPEASFDIDISGTSKTLSWKANATPPDELATVAVFDVHCARAYLTNEQDIAYMPYGLDVVENLANKVMPELSNRLVTEIASIDINKDAFNHLLGETAVGELIRDLSEKTGSKKVEELATLTKKQSEKISELEKVLKEPDPKIKAQELQRLVERLKNLAANIQASLAWADEQAIARLKSLDEAATIASEAEKAAAGKLQAGESLLKGTGELVWKELFEAARKFSTEVAYPEHSFPNIEEGALCPLCQQPVDDVGDRLSRFEHFIQDNASKIANEKRREVEIAINKIKLADLSVRIDKALADELNSLDNTLTGLTHSFESSITTRRVWMLEATKNHVWDNLVPLAENPRLKLRNLAAKQLKMVRVLEKASDENKIKNLKKEYDELIARQNLFKSLKPILELIDRMKQKNHLESCQKDLKTRHISEKSKIFASSAVTETLKDALQDEFNKLNIRHIKTKLNSRPDKGKIWHKILLDLPSNNKLEEILSEGEQRAIAIGSFLAELRLGNHSGGIVFDDPVSSLDHHRRHNVAKRLVEEAKHRQVIVFTHDTTFLGELRDAIDQTGITHIIQYLEWSENKSGYVSAGLPWGHKSYDERIDFLEKSQKTLEKKPWPAYPNEGEISEMRRMYGRMRATIERVVQDLIFNGVIQRYRDWVRVEKLRDVVGFEKSECDRITKLNNRCGGVIEGHDSASPVPSAKELGEDINELKEIIAIIRDRRKRNQKTPTKENKQEKQEPETNGILANAKN